MKTLEQQIEEILDGIHAGCHDEESFYYEKRERLYEPLGMKETFGEVAKQLTSLIKQRERDYGQKIRKMFADKMTEQLREKPPYVALCDVEDEINLYLKEREQDEQS